MAAVPGSVMPSASAIEAMVLAVPITPQLPAVVARLPSMASISRSETSLARYFAQKRRQSVQAPRRSPRYSIGSIGPPMSCTAGTSAEAAPINSAGTVLSQPPTRTTASIGWARIISSASIAMRLRNIMLVGLRKVSPSEMVGKSIGSAPAASTPRFTASTSSGKCRWQLLKPPAAWQIPTTRRDSMSVE